MSTIVVSNGTDFFEIDSADLASARSDGFYVPHEQGLAVVTNDSETLEIPLDDLPAAEADGFRCISERGTNGSAGDGNGRVRRSRPKAAAVSGVRIDTGESEAAVDDAVVDVEEVPDEEEVRREELRREMEEATGVAWFSLWVQLHLPSPEQRERMTKTYGLALLLHLIVFVMFSFWILADDPKWGDGAILSSLTGADTNIADAAELPQEVVVDDQSDSEDSDAADPSGEIADALGETSSDLANALQNAGGGLEGLSEAIGEGLDPRSGNGEKTSAAFFGSKTVASEFVFVIDNSLSMTKGRFETALNELAKTIAALTPEQSYYVIFYSDTAYTLFHPSKVSGLVAATPRNKRLTLQWLTTVPLCLKTDFAEALFIAYRLDPDVIFVLGDGAFTDFRDVQKVMSSRGEQHEKIRIHALGMEVSQKDAQNFIYLSKQTGGSYRDVGVHPAGRVMAQKAPRPRFKNRAGVWGLKLPQK